MVKLQYSVERDSQLLKLGDFLVEFLDEGVQSLLLNHQVGFALKTEHRVNESTRQDNTQDKKK